MKIMSNPSAHASANSQNISAQRKVEQNNAQDSFKSSSNAADVSFSGKDSPSSKLKTVTAALLAALTIIGSAHIAQNNDDEVNKMPNTEQFEVIGDDNSEKLADEIVFHDAQKDEILDKVVTVVKWGTEAEMENKHPNDCLWNIARNHYPDTEPNDAMELIMAANPNIYNSGDINSTIIPGDTLTLPGVYDKKPECDGTTSHNRDVEHLDGTTAYAVTNHGPDYPNETVFRMDIEDKEDTPMSITPHGNGAAQVRLLYDGTMKAKLHDNNGKEWQVWKNSDGEISKLRGLYGPEYIDVNEGVELSAENKEEAQVILEKAEKMFIWTKNEYEKTFEPGYCDG